MTPENALRTISDEALRRVTAANMGLTILTEALLRAVPDLERTLPDVIDEIRDDPRASMELKYTADEMRARLIHRGGRALKSGLAREWTDET